MPDARDILFSALSPDVDAAARAKAYADQLMPPVQPLDDASPSTFGRISRGLRDFREAISPSNVFSPSDIASFAPGGGLVNAWHDSGKGMQSLAQGDWSGAAANYGNMLLNMVPEGAALGKLAMFAGPAAKTADHALLAEAQRLSAGGADARKVWDETGWFTGADGKWRFEIPDNGASFALRDSGGREMPLHSSLAHPQLFDAYPQLSDTPTVVKQAPARGGHYLSIEPGDGAMELRAPDHWQGRSVALHESQHGVQNLEGFDRGGNSMGLKPNTPAWDIYMERRAVMEQSARENGMPSIPAWIDVEAQKSAAQEAYRRMAGEVEARNVQTRMDMQPWERRATPPWETKDVPRDQQIVRQR